MGPDRGKEIRRLARHDLALAAAVRVGDKDATLAGIRITAAHEGEALAVGRKADGAVYPLQQLDGCAAEHGDAVQSVRVVSLDRVIQVVTVARESDAEVAGAGRGRNDLRVVGGCDLPKPEALFARVAEHVGEVFAVGRDGGMNSFTGIGESRQLHFLEGHGAAVDEPVIDSCG